MSARKLACDGCRKSKVRCDGQEGVSTCSRCAKKAIDCTWDTPRSKRGRKSHNNRLNTESGMGLFCLTPKNLIELNYTAHHNNNPHHHSNNRSPSADPHNHHPVDPASPQPHHSHPHPHPHSQQQGHLPEQHQYYHHQTPPGTGSPQVPHEENWKLPLPLHSRERFMKPKSNSLEGLPSLHKIHLMSPRSQRPRSLDELVVNVNPATPTATNTTTTTGTNSTTSSPSTPQHTPHLPHHHHHHPSPSSSSFIPLHHPQTPTSPPSNISYQHPAPPPSPSLSLPIDIPNNNFEVGKDMELDDSETEQQPQPQPQPQYHHFNIPQQQIMNNGLIFNPSMSPSSSRYYNNKLPDSPQQAYPHNPMTTSNPTMLEATAMEPSLQYNHMIIQNSMMNMMIQPTPSIQQHHPLQTLSQEEAVRKKCSIEALINTDQDEDNYPLFQNYPSRK